MDEDGSENGADRGEDIAALEILGAFLFVLGCAMVVAVFWPPTWAGKLTNLLVAVLLLVIGAAMFLSGRAGRRAPARRSGESAGRQTRPTNEHTD